MHIIESGEALQAHLNDLSQASKSLGFVPTMGALHQGHLSLIERAKRENDSCLCSIFVNPTQFNNSEDLKKYPRDLEADIRLLQSVGCDALFHPSFELMYPGSMPDSINLGLLEETMEGQFRPGHFQGVAAVVKRFFDLIQPTRAYFGLKDFQQFAVISHMVRTLNIPVELIGCETTRSESGLALSSRNLLLSESGKAKATLFYESLNKAKSLIGQKDIAAIKEVIKNMFLDAEYCELEYFEMVNSETLEPVQRVSEMSSVTACIAGYVEGVRLIDNLVIIP